jgi:expansin
MNTITYKTALVISLFVTHAFADSSIHTGEGTFYGYGGGGNCSFETVPETILTAAMNARDYDGSKACGGVIEVTNENTGQSVIVRIDDQCPECAQGDVDLDQDAFAQISDISAGRIPIHWHYISNDQAGSMKLYFKEGSSQWWTGIQVRDHKYPITSLEYRISGSNNAYTAVPREPYNYFIANSGFGVGPYDFRITDFWGDTVEVTNIALVLTTEIDTGIQFPAHDEQNHSSSAASSSQSSYSSSSTPSSSSSTSSSSSSSASSSALTCNLNVVNVWNTGYQASIVISNPTNTLLNAWQVAVDLPQGHTITQSWSGAFDTSGNPVIIRNLPENSTIAPGDSISLGYVADYQGTFVQPSCR